VRLAKEAEAAGLVEGGEDDDEEGADFTASGEDEDDEDGEDGEEEADENEDVTRDIEEKANALSQPDPTEVPVPEEDVKTEAATKDNEKEGMTT